jgi:phospholipid transport system substrate-binding protein
MFTAFRLSSARRRSCGLYLLLGGLLALLAWPAAAPASSASADPAVKFMAQVGRELMAAARTQSPSVISGVFQRYADVTYIGLYSLGSYRNALPQSERSNYFAGMVRFIGRYAATEAPKYPIAKVEWANESIPGANGIMVDSRITLSDGSAYDVRWVVVRHRNTFRVRDAMIGIFSSTQLLQKLFEDYIAQNGGNPRALVAVLNRP